MLSPLAAEGRTRGSPPTFVENAQGSIPTLYYAPMSRLGFRLPFRGNPTGFRRISCLFCPLTEALLYQRGIGPLLMVALRLKRQLFHSFGWWEESLDRSPAHDRIDRKSTRLNASHLGISYAVFC